MTLFLLGLWVTWIRRSRSPSWFDGGRFRRERRKRQPTDRQYSAERDRLTDALPSGAFPKANLASILAWLGFIPATLVLLVGCQTRLGRSLEWRKPFAATPPAYKSAYGPTPKQRMQSLKEIAARAPRMSQQEATQTVSDLTRAFADEPDPIIRREMVKAVAAFRVPEVQTILESGLNDPVAAVREAACRAWGASGSNSLAVGLLADRMRNDPDPDVRRAAIEGLAALSVSESVFVIAQALDDQDPAMQVVAMNALKRATSYDAGRDVQAWRAYVNSLPRPPAIQAEHDSQIRLATAIGD